MEITPDGIPWSSDDEAHWNAFLKTPTGLKLIGKALESVPPLLSGGNVNEILIRSGELRGYQLFVRELLTLSHARPLPPKQMESYPDLDDDSKWLDQGEIRK